jgi:predicted nucleotidyltransferase
MEIHHRESLDLFLDKYTEEKSILAILLTGSLAHGFARPDSDIDIVLIADEEEYRKRERENKLAFSLWDICTYPGGYIDCKVVTLRFLSLVAERGSDPARFAFKDSVVLRSCLDNLDELLKKVILFPSRQKEERRHRFASQILAWKWYYSEAIKQQNNYLIYLALHKLILFSCRLILNENNMLYPYHKWLLTVTDSAPNKPRSFDSLLGEVMNKPTIAVVENSIKELFKFLNLEEKYIDWPNTFLKDSEWNWVDHDPPVDDL